jgi:hypothetical protein
MSYDIMLLLVVAIPVLFRRLFRFLEKFLFYQKLFCFSAELIPFFLLIIIFQAVQAGIR